MFQKCVKTVVAVFVALAVMVPVAAAGDMVFGRISAIDPAQGSLALESDGNIRQFTAPAELLEGLLPGDMVRVVIVDGKVKHIRMGDRPHIIPDYSG